MIAGTMQRLTPGAPEGGGGGSGGSERPTPQLLTDLTFSDPNSDMDAGGSGIDSETGVVTLNIAPPTASRHGYASGVLHGVAEMGAEGGFLPELSLDDGDSCTLTLVPDFGPDNCNVGVGLAVINAADPALATSGYGISLYRQNALYRLAWQTNGVGNLSAASAFGDETQVRIVVRRFPNGATSLLTIRRAYTRDNGATLIHSSDQLAANFGDGPVYVIVSALWIATPGLVDPTPLEVKVYGQVERGAGQDLSALA